MTGTYRRVDERPLLDWCCIGAQKAGTSTLFALLKDHPELYIPPGKEEPLFHRPVSDAEVRAYRTAHFPAGLVSQRRAGTVTPQYMSSPETAARLHAAAPEARIVVLLRDPARRAVSHYRMNVRRQLETRTFAQAVEEQVADIESGRPVDPNDETATYVYRGLYGHILEPWYQHYGADLIHAVFTDELEHEPETALHGVHRFLGVAPHSTGREGTRAHADPPAHRFPTLRPRVSRVLRRIGVLQLMSGPRREGLAYRLEAALARVAPPPEDRDSVDQPTIERLRDFYQDDAAAVEKLIGRPPTWVAS